MAFASPCRRVPSTIPSSVHSIGRSIACYNGDGFNDRWREIVMSGRAIAICGMMAAFCLPSVTQMRAADITPALIEKTAQANFREFFDMLALPNDAINAEDIRKNADWLDAAFRKRGFATQQLANDGKPLVFAEFARKIPNARTVLFYMHFDGMPVIPNQWAQASPWTAVVKQRSSNAGPPPLATFTPARTGAAQGWQEIDAAALQERLDPELRVFARSSSDDKGPIMMFLTAFDVLAAAGLTPAINVKILLDSEEEKGSPTSTAWQRRTATS